MCMVVRNFILQDTMLSLVTTDVAYVGRLHCRIRYVRTSIITFEMFNAQERAEACATFHTGPPPKERIVADLALEIWAHSRKADNGEIQLHHTLTRTRADVG